MRIFNIITAMPDNLNLTRVAESVASTRRVVRAMDKVFYSGKEPLKITFAKPNTSEKKFKELIVSSMYPSSTNLFKNRGKFPWYTLKHTIHSKQGYTDGIFNCLAILLHNKNEAYLMHLCPRHYINDKSINFLQRGINKYISLLKRGNQNVESWIVGGQQDKSKHLFTIVKNIFTRQNIPQHKLLYSKNPEVPHSVYYNLNSGIIMIDEGKYGDVEGLKKNFINVTNI